MGNLLNRRQVVAITLVTIVSTLFSIAYIDEDLAIWIMEFLRSRHALRLATSNIPDTLLFLVCVGTTVMWLGYSYLTRKETRQILRHFLKIAATAVPVAYVVKSFLQYAFGRTNTRFWLRHDVNLQFSWFQGGGVGGFPSGHMMVFTAFGAAVYYMYPSLRLPTGLMLLLLAMALIVTDYHFLGDVIAGAYLGLMVTYLTILFLKPTGESLRPPQPLPSHER